MVSIPLASTRIFALFFSTNRMSFLINSGSHFFSIYCKMVDNNQAFHIYYGAVVLNCLLRHFYADGFNAFEISKSNLIEIYDGSKHNLIWGSCAPQSSLQIVLIKGDRI